MLAEDAGGDAADGIDNGSGAIGGAGAAKGPFGGAFDRSFDGAADDAAVELAVAVGAGGTAETGAGGAAPASAVAGLCAIEGTGPTVGMMQVASLSSSGTEASAGMGAAAEPTQR